MSDAIVHIIKTQKKFFVNNFCVINFRVMKLQEAMVAQISAVLSYPNFHSEKSYVKKIIVINY